MNIQTKLAQVRENLPNHVELVAVSKTKPNEDILEAYEVGQRVFGENKVQDLSAKWDALPKDIRWHFIGHLQTNKVKYIAPFVSLIHSIDSIKLLKEVNKQAKKNNRIIDCLLQFHVAQEETKFGLNLSQATELLDSEAYASFQNIRIVGIMGMASFVDNDEEIREEFRKLKHIFQTLKRDIFHHDDSFSHLSMGMSGDYKLAIEEGSTMVRVGSTIFGSRNY